MSAELTISEAARLLGRKGGARLRDSRGREYLSEIGGRGGRATKARHGPQHLREIGGRGGRQTKAVHGAQHFSRMAELSLEAKQKKGRKKR